MTAHITKQQARQLGLDLGQAGPKVRANGTRARTEFLPTRCCTDGETFTRPIDEDRHFQANPTHRRYETVHDNPVASPATVPTSDHTPKEPHP